MLCCNIFLTLRSYTFYNYYSRCFYNIADISFFKPSSKLSDYDNFVCSCQKDKWGDKTIEKP